MSRIEKMALNNMDQIMANMQTIQDKMDMFNDNTTSYQKSHNTKMPLIKKILSWGAWGAWDAWDKY